jgi:uncharacterized membrane protein
MDEVTVGLALLDAVLAATALAAALWIRPWRALPVGGPPWAWLALWLVVPLSWGLDRWLAVPQAVPLSLATLAVLLAGWPLAVVALAVATLPLLAAQVGPLEVLHRLAWLGVVPATFSLALGALVRGRLPHHPMIYILGRGYFGTFVATLAAHGLSLALRGPPRGMALDSALIAHVLAAFAEAFLTGMVVAIAVAFRPAWLATWSDRVYLPPAPRP